MINALPTFLSGLRVTPWSISIAFSIAFLIAGAGPWIEEVADFFGRIYPFWVREDFTAFYAAGRLVTEGLWTHLYDISAVAGIEHAAAGRPVGGSGLLPYFNPPFFAFLFAPLSHLSVQQAYQVWTLINITLLAVNGYLLWRLARPLSNPWRVALLAGYLTLYPLVFGLRLGQFSLILQLSVASTFLLLRNDRDRLAGVSLSLLLIKPELVLPFALFVAVKRRWQVFATLVPLTLAAIAVSIAIVGVREALEYPGYLMQSTTTSDPGVAPDLMINWSGMIAASFGRGPSLVRPVIAGIAGVAGVLAVVVLARRPDKPTPSRSTLEWFALVLATILADPHFYLQDTIIAVPAAVALVATLTEGARPAAALALTTSWVIQRLALYPNQFMHVNLFAISLAAAFAGSLVWLWWESREREPEPVRAQSSLKTTRQRAMRSS